MKYSTTAGTRLRLLEKEISKGNMEALPLFWDEVEASGAPLVEPCGTKTDSVYLSFVYRNWNPNINVIAFGSFPGYRYKENLLVQLKDTDVWFKTYILRNDVRFSYAFSVMEHFSEDYQEISKHRILDDLNPKKIVFDKDADEIDSEDYEISLVKLLSAPEHRWTNEDKASKENKSNRADKCGRLILYRLPELKEKEPRRVWAYTPQDYDPAGQPCNLVVLMDGLEFVEKLQAKNVLDNLFSENMLPPTICVFIDNKDNRYAELTCNTVFSELIITELVPWVRKHYNISIEPEKAVLGGFSLGGLAAAYIAMNHSIVFGKVLSLSGSFWWEEEKLIEMYKEHPVLPLTFYLSVGLLEDEPFDTEPIMMKCMDRFYEMLLGKGNTVYYEKFHSGHDYLSWGESFGEGLIKLFGSVK